MAILLTIEAMKANALKTFNNKRLTAQAPYWEDRVCVYGQKCKDDGVVRVCAIGASLPEELALNVATVGFLPTLEGKGYVKFPDKQAQDFAIRLQDTHDHWARYERNLGYTKSIQDDPRRDATIKDLELHIGTWQAKFKEMLGA